MCFSACEYNFEVETVVGGLEHLWSIGGVPFLEQAPEDLLPQLIVIENNYMKWKRDLLALAKTRGYVNKTITRMNVILEKI